MLVQAVLIGFIAMFVTFEWMLGTNLGSRPIITGVLVGLVMVSLIQQQVILCVVEEKWKTTLNVYGIYLEVFLL